MFEKSRIAGFWGNEWHIYSAVYKDNKEATTVSVFAEFQSKTPCAGTEAFRLPFRGNRAAWGDFGEGRNRIIWDGGYKKRSVPELRAVFKQNLFIYRYVQHDRNY